MKGRRALAWFGGVLVAAAGGCGSSGAAPGADGALAPKMDAALDGVLITTSSVVETKHDAGMDVAVVPDAGWDGPPDAGDAGAPDASLDAGGDAGLVIPPDLCNQKCALAAQIDCAGAQTLDTCISRCVADSSCVSERVAYYQCLIAGGADALMCDPSIPAVELKDGFCTQESDNYFDCD